MLSMVDLFLVPYKANRNAHYFYFYVTNEQETVLRSAWKIKIAIARNDLNLLWNNIKLLPKNIAHF